MSDFIEETWLPPPPSINLGPGEVHVWRISLDRQPQELEILRPVLNEEELNRAARFYFERDRNRFVFGRAILRKILGLYLSEDPTGLIFEYGQQGKPALTGENPLKFNLSHSHLLALLAVTYNNRVGVDIEYPKENIAMTELVARFFAPVEVETFRKLPVGQQRKAFFNAWTRKEAYLKACGGGLSIGLDRVVVSFLPEEVARIVEIDGSKQEAARWSLAALNPASGYQATLVVETPAFSLKCWKWPD